MLKHIFFAILVGVGMAACLDSREKNAEENAATAQEQSTTIPQEEEASAIDPALLVISKGQVGSIKIGTPIDQMRQNVPAGLTIADTTLQQEGQQYTAYTLHISGQGHGLLVEQLCEPSCKVWRINVNSPEFKTASGIGIGSKYDEVRQKYTIKYVSPGEGKFVAVAEEAGLSFILDESQLPKGNPAKLKPDDVPANTLVTGILVY